MDQARCLIDAHSLASHTFYLRLGLASTRVQSYSDFHGHAFVASASAVPRQA